MDEQEGRIAACVEAYDAQGWHRTGTAVDSASGEWLAACIRDLGYEVELEAYGLSRVDIRDAYVEIEGRRIEGLPLVDGGFTDAAGVSGRMGNAANDADIALAVAGAEAGAEGVAGLRRDDRHRGLVLLTEGRRPGLMAHNASDFTRPFGPPALQVSSEEGVWLRERADAGAVARLVAYAERVEAQSGNVVARLPGDDGTEAPVIVTTPRSGWWHCASERGGGIAAWLEVARSVVERRRPIPVWFVAFSGHELGHLGSDAFVDRHPEMVRRARAWVHFGANVGGAVEPMVRVSASTDELLRLAKANLETRGVAGVTQAPVGRVLGLESGDIASRGGTCVSLLGGNALFHLESDRWPQAVDVSTVAAQANAIADLVIGLAS